MQRQHYVNFTIIRDFLQKPGPFFLDANGDSGSGYLEFTLTFP
jgi:hypothetical protein